jgi:peptidoglycan hydrolase CwlO-like protein
MIRIGIFFCLAAMLLVVPLLGWAETDAERRERLEEQLAAREQEILRLQGVVEGKQAERQTLERDLDILDAQITKAQLGIEARAVAIDQLGDQIIEKRETIDILDERMQKQRQSVGDLLRKTQEVDDFTLVELMLSNERFSSFFADFENFRSINDSLKQTLDALREIRIDTVAQKESLEEKRYTEAELKEMQEAEKAVIESREAEKENILEVTKGEEAVYQNLLEENRRTAAQLRAALFELSGGGGAIPFPDAVALAKISSDATGVSPALILAILEQESHYGSNIGSCVYNEVVHGRDVMHPDRDQPPFKALADVLGFDPARQQISCPWIRSGERIGWGGAMGASQFIPSTWAMYGGLVNQGGTWTYDRSSDAIRRLTGSDRPSNPFNNRDAFVATGLLMRDNGANGGTYRAEWTAAIRYFSGWAGVNNPINHPYGDNVMARKQRLEQEIRILDAG